MESQLKDKDKGDELMSEGSGSSSTDKITKIAKVVASQVVNEFKSSDMAPGKGSGRKAAGPKVKSGEVYLNLYLSKKHFGAQTKE